MAFELSIQSSGKHEIQFIGYEKTLDDVRRLAERMKEQEVTEENIIENKKLLAEIRKEIKKLDSERLAVKRQIMTPYDELNEKTKVLKEVLGEGEGHINAQIYRDWETDRKSTRLNSSHSAKSRMPSSA